MLGVFEIDAAQQVLVNQNLQSAKCSHIASFGTDDQTMAEYSTPTTTLDTTLTSQLGSSVAQEILSLLNSGQTGQTDTSNAQVVTGYTGGTLPAGTDIVYVDPSYTGPISGTAFDNATAIIVPSTGSAQVILNGGVDKVISLGGGNDTVKINGTGSDVINNAHVGDNVDTGAGFDKVVVAGNLSDYHTVVTTAGVQLVDASGHSLTVSNAEFIQFSDGSVMINAKTTNDATVAKFYDLILDRNADAHGTDYWWTSDNGTTPSVTKVADTFLHSQEFTAQHGNVDTMSNTDFISIMYQNAFGRGADTQGVAYWDSVLKSGAITKADLVVYFATSKEDADHTANTIHVIPDILH